MAKNYLLTIIIIASFLRLYNLTELPPGLYPDEAMNGNNAVEAWEDSPPAGGWKVFYKENFGREGLFINIQSLLIGFIGLIDPMGNYQPWALRLPSAIFGILTVLGLYFFTKELFDKDSKAEILALLAAFLLATSFWHINFSRIGFRAIMAPAFLVWSLCLLLKSINQTKNNYQLPITNYQFWKLGIRNWALPALAGAAYGLGFYSYIAYRATPLLVAFILWLSAFRYGWRSVVRAGATFAAAAILIALPLGIYFLQNPQDFLGRTAGISIFGSETPILDLAFNILKTAGMFNVVGDFNWRHNLAGRPMLFFPVGIMFLVGLFIAGRDSIKKSKISHFTFHILLFWIVIAALPVVISNEGLPHALRSLLMIPPVFILAAVGGLKIYEFLKSKIKSPLLPTSYFLFLSLLAFEAYLTYFMAWGRHPAVKNAFAHRDYLVAQQLNSLPKELPKYIVVSDATGVIERDNPISLQPVLFLTDTFTKEKRREKNFIYLTRDQFNSVSPPPDSVIIKL